MRYDVARKDPDRHPSYILVAYMARHVASEHADERMRVRMIVTAVG